MDEGVELRRVQQLLKRFEKRDIPGLKRLSAECARDAFVLEQKSLVDLSLLAYALAKLSQKHYIVESSEWKSFSRKINTGLKQCAGLLQGKSFEEARQAIHSLLASVQGLSSHLGRFAKSVVDQGRLKAAAQMYAHGASLGAASQFAGADKREVAAYVGRTRIPDKYDTLPLRERIENARKVFVFEG